MRPATEHEQHAETWRALYHAADAPTYVLTVAAVGFGALALWKDNGRPLAIVTALVAVGFWLIRRGALARARHHEERAAAADEAELAEQRARAWPRGRRGPP